VTDVDAAAAVKDGLPVDPALVDEAAGLDETAATDRHEDLARQIEEANRAYYEADAPLITDAEYDQLFRRLVALETAFPALVTPASPTQQVGAVVGGTFDEVRHRLAGVPHQGVDGDLPLLDRPAVDLLHLFAGDVAHRQVRVSRVSSSSPGTGCGTTRTTCRGSDASRP
jgi:hypothetical protein